MNKNRGNVMLKLKKFRKYLQKFMSEVRRIRVIFGFLTLLCYY